MTNNGRLALVTGGAGGLGRGVAAGLARAGHRVAFTYRPGGTPPNETLALVQQWDPGAVAIASDSTREPEAARALRIAAERAPADILVHLAGPIVIGPFVRATYDDYRTMADANLGSAVALARAVLPGMRERGFGRLIFFGMNGSHQTEPALNLALYASTKAAVTSFARTLSIEEARHGITVNVVEPGDIRDKNAGREAARAIPAKNPTGHAGSWEDIAGAVVFFASDDASFINGQVLSVNGGLTEAYER